MKLKTLLVVDDDAGDRFITEVVVKRYSEEIRILTALDGAEALEILKSSPIKPDVILLDINMPGMNGHEFLECYNEQEEQCCVVVMLTSSAQQVDKDQCAVYSFVKSYIEKPLEIEDLKKIEKLL